MSEKVESLENEIRQAMVRFLLALKTGHDVSYDDFEIIKSRLNNLLVIHKPIPLINKSFLADLYSFPSSVRNELMYSKEKDFLLKSADLIEEYFGLLLSNEIPSERQSGVPRIF